MTNGAGLETPFRWTFTVVLDTTPPEISSATVDIQNGRVGRDVIALTTGTHTVTITAESAAVLRRMRGRSPLSYTILNKNVALRSETHRAISFSAFCAFRGKSRGRDAPPTTTLQDIN